MNAVLSGGLDASCGSFADCYLARKIALMRGFCYAPAVVAAWRISASSVSRQTSLNPQKATAILDTVPPRLAADPVFPPGYAELFRRRWQFASSRLALEVDPINYDIVEAMNARSALDKRALKLVRRLPFPWLQRFAALAWLSLRLRRFPLWALVATRLSRSLAPD